MQQKWYKKTNNQAALVGGIFLLLTAIATGVFNIITKSVDYKNDLNSQLKSEQIKEDFSDRDELCKIKIIEFKINYSVNGFAWYSYLNDPIKAGKGDTLLLNNVEMILSINDSCKTTKIAIEAFIKKPNVKNLDPQDKFDYNDGRFTEGKNVTNVIKLGDFFALSGTKEWILQSKWDDIVISLIEYSHRYPKGYVFERLHFKIQK